MKPLDCCLTLICHSSLEERLVDHMLAHPEWVPGFTVTRTEGHSQQEKLPSVLEQVRGRSRRIEIRSVMNAEDAHALVALLKVEEPNPEITYWISPVSDFGRLA